MPRQRCGRSERATVQAACLEAVFFFLRRGNSPLKKDLDGQSRVKSANYRANNAQARFAAYQDRKRLGQNWTFVVVVSDW